MEADEASNIVSAIQNLKNNHLYTDFQFISSDGLERCDVHKLFVALHSHYLSQLFVRDPTRKEFRIENIGKSALQNMIRYFYSESVVLQNISDVNDTKEIAERFGVVGLLELCKEKLSDIEVTVTNVLDVIKTAEDFKNQAKQNECIRLIGENQDTVLKSHEFNQMPFNKVISIFIQLKSHQLMTEAGFLRAAVKWFQANESMKNKNLIMENFNICNISMDDFLDILVSHPNFFEKTEISDIVREIRSRPTIKVETEIPRRVNNVRRVDSGTNTENKTEETDDTKRKASGSHTDVKIKDLQKKLEEKEELINDRLMKFETLNTDYKDLLKHVQKLKDEKAEKPKVLTIRILEECDGCNIFGLGKRARITIQDKNSTRSLQPGVCDVMKKGLLGTLAQKNSTFTESNVDISYEGIYYMIRSLAQLEDTLTPLTYIEVLKAALFFQLTELSDKCIMKINSLIDFDPLFLDGLKKLPYFEEKWLSILSIDPIRVLLHPNFIECSPDLIMSVLDKNELRVNNESQLLLIVIPWLEAYNKKRSLFRDHFLKKLAFEKISTPDFRYIILHNPNFFTKKEQEDILAYRNAVGSDITECKKKLPEWYNFKTRKIM